MSSEVNHTQMVPMTASVSLHEENGADFVDCWMWTVREGRKVRPKEAKKDIQGILNIFATGLERIE